MAISAQLTVLFQVTSAIGGSSGDVHSMVTPVNSNAPPPNAATLQPGTNTIVVPTGFTVSVAFIRPPSTSTNVKAVGTGSGAWTSAPLVVPVTAGGTLVITSTSSETVEIDFG